MFWWIAAMLVGLALFQLASFLLQRRDHAWEKGAMAVQALATTLALMFAGYWYVYERKGQPQADTRLEVIGLKLPDDLVTLEARFAVRNLGSTLLEVGGADARLQAIGTEKNRLPFDAIAKLDWQDFPAKIGDDDGYDDGVLMWPTIKWFRGTGFRRIEPGETDIRVVDFVASCRGRIAMRLYFAVQRPGTDQVWSDQAILGMARLCRQPAGTREDLSERKDD